MWNEINNDNDLVSFMNRISFFHDSCIKELKYLTCNKQIKDLEDEAHLMDNKVVNLQYKYDKLNEEYMEYKERMKAYE